MELYMKTTFIKITLVVLLFIAGVAGWFLLQCEDDWCFIFEWQKIRAADRIEPPNPPAFEAQKTGHIGILQGTMTIGPVCPVERIDHPCKPTSEMFAARKIFIYLPDRATLTSVITPDGEGNFSVKLPEGTYWITMQNQGIGSLHGVPQSIEIKEGMPVRLMVGVDTGIR